MIANLIDLSNEKLSESEEMYLAAIARLQETGLSGPAPISQLAAELAVLPVSANQMVRKLEQAGLLTYAPYKGVELTDSGKRQALRILRHRRLWEVFLVERLHYTPDEAGALACRLEHILPAEAAERLASFLGDPQQNPTGRLIPPAGAQETPPNLARLHALGSAQSARVAAVEAGSAAASFLDLQGIRPGARLSVSACSSSGQMLVQVENGPSVSLAEALTQQIWVAPAE